MAQRNRRCHFSPCSIALERKYVDVVILSAADIEGLSVWIKGNSDKGIRNFKHLLLDRSSGADVVNEHIFFGSARNQGVLIYRDTAHGSG